MKSLPRFLRSLIIAAATLLPLSASAQDAATATTAATTAPAPTGATGGGRGGRGGPAGVASPVVHPDHTVTFSVRRPEAKSIAITGADWTNLNETIPLTKDDTGLWSVTVGPLAPMNAIYNFTIDGVVSQDQGNPRIKLRTNIGAPGSLLYVPGTPPEMWEARDVPHGTVEVNWAKSPLHNDTRSYNVYTPPGYNADSTTKYPVLYLFHGSNGTQDEWTNVGHAHFIADNLIAAGKAVPMIIVMTWGHDNLGSLASGQFERYLLDEVMPAVEKKYRVAPGRENRAIVGLSMGGGQALNIGLSHLDLFASVGGYSYAFTTQTLQSRYAALLNDAAGTNAQLKVLWLGCGREDRTVQFANNKQVSDVFYDHGINHIFFEMDGAHTFAVWRKCLEETLPVLFKAEVKMPGKVGAAEAVK